MVWVAPATQKVRPQDPVPAGAATDISISAARNEFEAFQVIVTGTAKGVSARVTTPLANAAGAVLDLKLYREALITLQRASSSDPESATGSWPDALVPDTDEFDGQTRDAFPFDMRGVSRGIWAEVFVPAGAAAGSYDGVVTVFVGGQQYQTVSVHLTVWNFNLPATASARSAYALAYGALPTAFGFATSDTDAFGRLRARFGTFALDHRVSLSRHDDGLWYDLGRFEQVYGPLMNGTAPTRLQDIDGNGQPVAGAKLTSVEYLGPPYNKPGYEQYGDLASDTQRWSAFFADPGRGWSDRLFQYTADEPNAAYNTRWLDVPVRAAAAHAASPPVRSLVTTTLPEARAQAGTAGDTLTADHVIDVMVPAINFMDATKRHANFGTSTDPYSYDTFLGDPSLAPGNELWLYQSCMSHDCGGSSASGTGWPSYMIDASALRNRAMQWLMFAYETTGELYWETGYALYAKRDAWTNQWAYTGNGDGTLFYPGTPAKVGGSTNIPIASIRLKMIREGMEDFEYLTKLASHGPEARIEALFLAQDLFPVPNRTGVRSSQQLADMRAYIACRILALQGTPLGDGCVRPVLPTVQ